MGRWRQLTDPFIQFHRYVITNYKIILDWWHLQKGFRELFSMSFKGKDIRNEYRGSVPPLLWRGGIDKAVSVMENAEPLKSKTINA
jgi:hypothetical protein